MRMRYEILMMEEDSSGKMARIFIGTLIIVDCVHSLYRIAIEEIFSYHSGWLGCPPKVNQLYSQKSSFQRYQASPSCPRPF